MPNPNILLGSMKGHWKAEYIKCTYDQEGAGSKWFGWVRGPVCDDISMHTLAE